MAYINEHDFETHIGCGKKNGKFCTFIRVIHIPTGKWRAVAGLGKKPGNIEARLIHEIANELEREAGE